MWSQQKQLWKSEFATQLCYLLKILMSNSPSSVCLFPVSFKNYFRQCSSLLFASAKTEILWIIRKLREGNYQPNCQNGVIWVCCTSWMPILLAWSPHYCCLHVCPQYITPASGILSNHTFYLCGQVRKPHKTVPEAPTVTQNMLSASPVRWVAFSRLDGALTHPVCPWAG